MSQRANDSDASTISTTVKTFRILDALKEHEGDTLAELTRHVDLPKSTVFRHLSTLKELGYVVEADGKYYIGLQFLELGQQVRNREEGYQYVKKKVYELAEETGERVLFLVEENSEGVYLYRMGKSSGTLIGKRRPLHAMAAGKAILAEWADEELTTFIEEKGLDRLTENTITDESEFREELERTRERGYAVNNQEHMEGLSAVAVPVYTPDDELLGSLSVFGPRTQFSETFVHEELPALLRDKANEVKVEMRYD